MHNYPRKAQEPMLFTLTPFDKLHMTRDVITSKQAPKPFYTLPAVSVHTYLTMLRNQVAYGVNKGQTERDLAYLVVKLHSC